jgi:hypothetical protein
MNMQELAEKEINKIGNAVNELRLVKEDGKELYDLVSSYFTDAKHFLKEKKFVPAFEAAVIVWAYIDAGLHLGVFELPKEYNKLFTIE